jgi:hypothetical protein
MENPDDTFVLKGSLFNLIGVNILALVFGIGMLYLITRAGLWYGSVFFIVGSIILTLWLLIDVVIWYYRGVHQLHINPQRLGVVRGYKGEMLEITPEKIVDIYVYRRGYRKNLIIMLTQKVFSIPGVITLYPGKRIQLFSDAFDNDEFNKAVALLQAFYPVQTNEDS